MSTQAEKSGVHLTGADSGWPTGNVAVEPPYTKDGAGNDPFPDAESVAGGVISDDGTDEIQTITITGGPTGGTWTLALGAGGDETAGIAHNATGATVQTALEATDDFDSGDVSVSGVAGGPYTVTFTGQYADTDVELLVADDAGLTGGTTPAVGVVQTTAGEPQ